MKSLFKKVVLAAMFGLVLGCVHARADVPARQISTDQAPQAIGPYSQAVRAGSYLFIAGQIGMDPATGKLIDDSIEEQTEQVLNNIEAILAADGLTFENIVKSDVFLADFKDFPSMNKIYAERFSSGIKPARATVEVSKLPLGAKIEIVCVAYIPSEE